MGFIVFLQRHATVRPATMVVFRIRWRDTSTELTFRARPVEAVFRDAATETPFRATPIEVVFRDAPTEVLL